MTTTSAESHIVAIPALHACMLDIFGRVGMQAEYAEHIVAVLLDSELRGHDHHGVHLVRYVTTEVQRGVLNRAPNICTLRETNSTLLLDGDRGIVTPAIQAMRWCLDHVNGGVAIAGVRNCQPVALGFYVRLAAEAGELGFACANAIPSVAPPGGRTATIGTNPLAYAAPAGQHGPIVFDAAMTAIAGMAVQLAAEDGRALPDGVLLDSDGLPTTDPAARARGGLMAPLGYPHAAHKGFGLALMVEVLVGGLTGAAMGRELIAAPGTFGCTFWALDPESFMPRDQFLARLDELAEQIKQGDRAAGTDELLLPGERGERRRRELVALGTVPLTPHTWRALSAVCATLSVELPDLEAR